MDAPNWDEIRAEYIAGGCSYRSLAAKYDVPLRTLSDRARAEKWVELREQCRVKTVAETVDAIAKSNAKVDERIYSIANRLLDKLETAVEELDKKHVSVRNTLKTGMSSVTTEYRKVDAESAGPVDRGGMQSLSGVLRELQIILHDRSDLDRQEQMERIRKLQRDADGSDDDGSVIEVLFESGGVEDYA